MKGFTAPRAAGDTFCSTFLRLCESSSAPGGRGRLGDQGFLRAARSNERSVRARGRRRVRTAAKTCCRRPDLLHGRPLGRSGALGLPAACDLACLFVGVYVELRIDMLHVGAQGAVSDGEFFTNLG